MLKTALSILAILLNKVNGEEDTDPPKVTKVYPPLEGKFFYVDFPTFGSHGQHTIYGKVRNNDHDTFTSYPLYLTT